MAREYLDPHPGDDPNTKRYYLTNESILSDEKVAANIAHAKSEGRMITIKDVGDRPLTDSEVAYNQSVMEQNSKQHELRMKEWDQTPEGHLYLTCQSLAQKALQAYYQNPDGSYCGIVNAKLGHTKWTINTGSGWGEFYISWQTDSRMWRLTYAQNGWYLDCHQAQESAPQKLLGHDTEGNPIYHYNSKWQPTVKTHLDNSLVAERFGRLTAILEKLAWSK